MTKWFERQLDQIAVYWASPVKDGYGGFTWNDPVEIDCRWVGSTRVITNANGQEVVCRAEVVVDQDLDKEGVLYLGSLADLDSAEEDDPDTVDGAYRIQRFDKSPTWDCSAFYRKAYL